MKVLIGIPKGRDIEEFDVAVESVLSKFDKLFCCYFPSWKARAILRSTFLNSPEFTHLAILPDDMIVTPEAIAILLEDLNRQDYPVLCGLSYTDMSKSHFSISLKVVSPYTVKLNSITFPIYDFISVGSEIHKTLLGSPQPVIIKHTGDSFPIIRRDVVEKLSFYNDAALNGLIDHYGCCEDVVMCSELHELGIPIYCDMRTIMEHKKISDVDSQNKLQVGKKEPFIKFVPGNA